MPDTEGVSDAEQPCSMATQVYIRSTFALCLVRKSYQMLQDAKGRGPKDLKCTFRSIHSLGRNGGRTQGPQGYMRSIHALGRMPDDWGGVSPTGEGPRTLSAAPLLK